ncbi:MAG: polysaccharide pyruvyl transferase family protein [bacterium]
MIDVIECYITHPNKNVIRINYIVIQDGLKKKIWYETNNLIESDIILDNYDAIVIALIPYALFKNKEIKIPGTISKKLKDYINNTLIPVFLDKKYTKLSEINICENNKKINKANKKITSYELNFSYDNILNYEKIKKLDFIIDLNINGSSYDKYNEKSKKIRKFAKENNIKNISISSNISDLIRASKFQKTILQSFFEISAISFFNNTITNHSFYNKYQVTESLFDKIFDKDLIVNNIMFNKIDYINTKEKIKDFNKFSKYISEGNNINCNCEKCLMLPLKLDTYHDILNVENDEIVKYNDNKLSYINWFKKNKELDTKLFADYMNKLSIKEKISATVKKSKKIYNVGFVYLDVTNFGDTAIHETTKKMVEDILMKNDVLANFIDIDMGDNNHKLENKIKKFDHENISTNIEDLENLKQENIYKYFMTNEINKVHKCDVIIFCGGGLIKYNKQLHISLFMHEILQIAKKNNTPTIFNAVGIEGYNENNNICQLLKEMLNYKCIKSITTRDDMKILSENYITNKKISIEKVSDPAISISNYFMVKKEKSDIVGINIIRFNIFQEYEKDITEEELIVFYEKLINILLEKQVNFKLYTNGVYGDYKMINIIKEKFLHIENFQDYIEPLPCNAYDLVQMISKYEVILNSRLHSSIIASSLEIPSLNMVWNDKQILFCKSIGYNDLYITANQFKAQEVYERLMEIKKTKIKINTEYLNSDYKNLEKNLKSILSIK